MFSPGIDAMQNSALHLTSKNNAAEEKNALFLIRLDFYPPDAVWFGLESDMSLYMHQIE